MPENTYIYSYNTLPKRRKRSRAKLQEKEGADDQEEPNQTTDGDLLWRELREPRSGSSLPSEDRCDSAGSDADKSDGDDFEKTRAALIKKIQLRQELVRGGYVQPTIACYPGESFIDVPEFYQYLNKGMIGNQITALKITITQDEIDCRQRKIVEEVTLCMYVIA